MTQTTDNSPQVGQLERKTQDRVVALFHDRLHYEYLGNWEDREDNSNINEEYLRPFLARSGYSERLIDKAITEINRTAGNQIVSLYDLNRETYGLLRYGVKVREKLGARHEDVWLIDWEHPTNNDFGIAEEVTVRGNRTKRPDIVLYINGIAVGVLELNYPRLQGEGFTVEGPFAKIRHSGLQIRYPST
jgi:type I restriction enzyme R subunit